MTAHTDHNGLSWTQITSDSSLAEISAGGSYYLTQDVTLTDTWEVPTGDAVNLCLNGFVIEQTGESYKSVINIPEGATLNLYDCGDEEHYFDKVGYLWIPKTTGTSDYSVTGGAITGGITTYGGGVYNEGTFNMYGGNIVGNTAELDGGGVGNYGTFNMHGGKIAGNTAEHDGGVGNHGTFNMHGGNIVGNTAEREGGGVGNYGTFNMHGGNIADNTAESEGGGVGNYGTFNMHGGNIVGNTAEREGGGVGNRGTFTLVDGSITGNTAVFGGGLFVESDCILNYGNINRNTATELGGGIFILMGSATISGVNIKDNAAVDGGGVTVGPGATLTMSGGNIEDNTATDNGGGVCPVSIVEYDTEYNTHAATFIMQGGIIKGNEAVSGAGVGMLVVRSGGDEDYPCEHCTFTMSGGSITGNIATGDGGGVDTEHIIFTVSGDAEITGNTVSEAANNVYLPDGRTIAIGSGGLTEGADIGVTTQTDPTEESTVDVTGAIAEANKKYFSADKADQHIDYVDGKIVIAAGAPPLPPGNGDVNVTYNNTQRYVVSIPDDINFEEDAYEYDNFVSVTEMWLEVGKQLNVSVKSNNRFNMIQGEPEAPASSIKYTMNIVGGAELDGSGFTRILVAPAGTPKDPTGYHAKSDLHYEVTSEALAAARFAGEHKDTLTFKVEVEDI